MKKSLENVIKVLKLRENENTKLSVYDEDKYDIQASFNSTSVPLVGDVMGILGCFFTNVHSIVKVDSFWGFTEIYLSDGNFTDEKVDTHLLSMFIPFNKANELKKIK